jgi:antitoxin CptB
MTEPDQAQTKSGDEPEGASPEGQPSWAQSRNDPRRRRLLFRATHRGTHENDLLIGGFVRSHLDTLTEAEIDALEVLLERPDPDLADWLTGRRPIRLEDATPMLLRIRASLVR